MDRNDLARHIPPDVTRAYGQAINARLQVYYVKDGRRHVAPYVIPAHEKARVTAEAARRGCSEADVVREAVFHLARVLGYNKPSAQEVTARRLAVQLGQDADLMVKQLGIKGPEFRPTVEMLARQAEGLSMSRAVRWALNVFFAK
jgi:hypothetical protein